MRGKHFHLKYLFSYENQAGQDQGGLFAGYFEPRKVSESVCAMAGGHGYIGKTFFMQFFGDIFTFYIIAQVGIYIVSSMGTRAMEMKMNKALMLYSLAGVLALATGCVTPIRRNTGISEAILKDDRPDLVRVASAAAGFRKGDFTAEQLGKYSDGELDRLYESLYRTTFYFPGQKGYITLQEKVLAEKAGRKRQTDEDAERMHWAYIGARMFDSAAALRQMFPGGNYPAIPAQITGADTGKTS